MDILNPKKTPLDERAAEIQEKKLNLTEDARTEEIEEVIDAEAAMREAVKRRTSEQGHLVKGIMKTLEANPSRLAEWQEDPATFIRSFYKEEISAAEVEQLEKDLGRAIRKNPNLQKSDMLFPRTSPAGTADLLK